MLYIGVTTASYSVVQYHSIKVWRYTVTVLPRTTFLHCNIDIGLNIYCILNLLVRILEIWFVVSFGNDNIIVQSFHIFSE